ncbi:hypothetical protein [Paenibacillus monticola]|uniref:Uncharacterized protein n=1 Tax=Paenibacillus monticola TaxID=2666075 RepID=A0A7X2L0T6_9BACL|nr:hypothetical protein [Paenibacillus monticola]MRN53062.1 hypothetical protein [Paenibacillus monticola]
MWIVTGLLIWIFLCGTILISAGFTTSFKEIDKKKTSNHLSSTDPFSFLFE